MNSYINKIFFLIGLFAFVFAGSLQSQNDLEKPKIILKADTDTAGINISWVIGSEEVYFAGLEAGYTLYRTDASGKKEVLNDRILPKDSMWFEGFPNLKKDYLKAVSFYAMNASFSKNALHNIMAEVEYSPEVAVALGLGFYDENVSKGETYTYALAMNKTGEALLDLSINYNDFVSERNPESRINFNIYPEEPLNSLRPVEEIQIDKIASAAQAFGDSIVIRWAPNNPGLWARAKEEGFVLTRREFTKDENDSLVLILTVKDSIFPVPSELLNHPMVIADSAALLAAQVLYGENMILKGESAGYYQQMAQSNLRFMIALQAADRSAIAATILGFRYVDNEVTPGSTYTYYVSLPGGNVVYDYIDIVNELATEKITPVGFEATSGDGEINLKWSPENQYTTFVIERSDDEGRTFKNLTPQPLVFIKPSGATTYAYTYIDSSTQNYKPYIYRLRGNDAFGNLSEPAELTAISIDLTPPTAPFITDGDSSPEGININWTIDNPPSDLDGFDIYVGKDEKSINEKITKRTLPSGARSFSYKFPVESSRSYYFAVEARDTAGNSAFSLSQYIHVIDSIPPAAPVGFEGFIDSLGIVVLKWEHNMEADLEGYRVYMNNNPVTEFAQISDSLVQFNLFLDTVPLNTLNRELYFKIAAEDVSRNTSDFSEMLVLLKPDTIRPVAPILHEAKGTSKGVDLKWLPSSSTDVAQQLVFRRLRDSTGVFEVIKSLDATTNQYTDETAETEVSYLYAIAAVDSAGNQSLQTLELVGRKFFDSETAGISNLNISKDKETESVILTWQSNDSEDNFLKDKERVYFLYRADSDSNFEKIKQLRSEINTFTDTPGTGKFQYAVRIVYDDGKMGKISQTDFVEFSSSKDTGGGK